MVTKEGASIGHAQTVLSTRSFRVTLYKCIGGTRLHGSRPLRGCGGVWCAKFNPLSSSDARTPADHVLDLPLSLTFDLFSIFSTVQSPAA